MMIDRIAGEQRAAEIRDHFGQSDKPQRQRIVCQFIDMPADHDRNDLVGKDDLDPKSQKLEKSGIAQRVHRGW